MEQFSEAAERQARRESVASFVQGSLQPAKQLLEEGMLDDLDEDVGVEAQGFEVRDYQLDAWGALWDARQAGAKTALIHLATGLGKTSVGVFDVIKFREEYKEQHGCEPRILFTCHQNEIIEQAAERFLAFIPNATQGFYNGEEKVRDANLTFATLQSLHVSLDTFEPNYFDYIIYDEAHHSKADTFEEVVDHFNPGFQLALTATPDRLDELNIRELFGGELYSKGLAQALAEGLLATPDYHIVFDDAVKRAMESGFEADTLKDLYQLLDIKSRNEVIARNIKEEMARIGLEFGSVKTILFCQDIAHAEEMARLLSGKAYHSGIANRKERKDTLNAFRHGDLQVICTRDMFNEGVDIPDARLLVFEQQLGRGLRKFAGKERVSVLDFVANVERIAMVRELATSVREYTQHGSYNVDEGSAEPSFSGQESTEDSAGLHIHTTHGDFDFDRLAVNLLDKFSVLKEASIANYKFSSYSPEEIINLALQLSPDKQLGSGQIRELSKQRIFPGHKIIKNLFGSITEFQKACGFHVGVSNEEIIEQALRLKPDGPLTTTEIVELSKKGKFISVSTITSRFGGVSEFQRVCGFDFQKSMSNEEIVDLALQIKNSGPLISSEIGRLAKEGHFVTYGTIVDQFGSVVEFQRACGFNVIDTKSMSNKDIIDLAKQLKPDGPLVRAEIKRLSRDGLFVSDKALRDRFGGVSKFQEACGYEVNGRTSRLQSAKMSNEELIILAQQLSPGKPFDYAEIKALSKEGRFVSIPTLYKRFGSLSAFREACGF